MWDEERQGGPWPLFPTYQVEVEGVGGLDVAEEGVLDEVVLGPEGVDGRGLEHLFTSKNVGVGWFELIWFGSLKCVCVCLCGRVVVV